MFVHLHVHSFYSMLDGASRLEDLIAKAVADGATALALTDHDSVTGLIPFQQLARRFGIQPIGGVDLTLEKEGRLVLLAKDEQGYENICRLLTLAYRDNRLDPRTTDAALRDHTQGLIAISGGRFSDLSSYLLKHQPQYAIKRLAFYREIFRDDLYIAVSRTALPGDFSLSRTLIDLANQHSLPVIATNDVHYAMSDDFAVHDLLVCMRLKTTVDEMHSLRPFNRENDMKSEAEISALFADYPECIEQTAKIAARCDIVPHIGESLFPAFSVPEHETSEQMLRRLVYEGAKGRYDMVDEMLIARLEHELQIITELGFVDYFLVVWDIARYARMRGIRYAGRGSAADSAVAYCLYITDVDAVGRNLLFERFMSLERAEKPDIDIDFDSMRRDEVRQYVYDKYGENHVVSVCTYSTFRGRSAVREIGKALSLPEAICDQLAKRLPFMLHADQVESALSRLPELRDVKWPTERLQLLFDMARKIAGFPRYYGTHVGGLVISRTPLLKTTPLIPSAKGVLITPFDKDVVEDSGLVKLDLLSLRTMSAIEDTLLQLQAKERPLDYDRIDLEDQETFAMIARGETIGVFQLESPAQRVLQSRLGASSLEDIVASVALIRPGPIKGNMVDPFLRRRKGQEVPTYIHPKLEPILSKTYGVVLFQEQVIEIATAIANFSPGEADQLRRVMSHARSASEMDRIGQEFIEKSVANGVPYEVAETIYSYMRGYASYGFCEAHAAAFATTAYKTAYLAQHMPAEFFASIINAQPMGYYPTHVLLAEVKRRGVRIYGLDINKGGAFACGDAGNLYLGFMQVQGMKKDVAKRIEDVRKSSGLYVSFLDFCVRVPGVDRLQLEQLIRAGAFDALEGNRRRLLWNLPGILQYIREREGFGELVIDPIIRIEHETLMASRMKDFSYHERLAMEYQTLGYGVSGHWMDLYRSDLTARRCQTITEALSLSDGALATVAGLVIRPHRPPTKSGKTVVFFSLEDEEGMIDVTVFQDVYHRDGAVLFDPSRGVIIVQGVIQRRQGGNVQMIAHALYAYKLIMNAAN